MILFLARRVLISLPVLLVIATITFFLLFLVPGGPFDREKKLPPEIEANINAKYHLDLPVWKQYLFYMSGLASGDLGPSYKYPGRSVNEILHDTFPVSMKLGLASFFVAISAGLAFGILAASFHGRWVDRAAMLLSSGGLSLPGFVLGSGLIFLFSIKLRLLPPALWEGWRYMVLPSLTLGLGAAAYIARLVRSSLLDISFHEFVRTARAKGLPESRVLLKHMLRNSISPVLTVSGPLLAGLVTGSFVVEYLFSIPGMGRYFITAVTNRDYPLIMGVTLVYAVVIVAANIIVDGLYAVVDPRVARR
ncbi:MAG TPA: ABC transporter permease [Nitrospiria bacterium]|nr:ABC transporter permease [Nitrospiria bacterium]